MFFINYLFIFLVIRTCGDETVGCVHNVDKWSDLCACEDSFCNTFSYLRYFFKFLIY